ncbi:O-acetyl-ADP-ribose deacetylase (regulator of RNase III), contains Macro domain [Nitrosomonas sp. Nm51]|uniref:macro domain-containing protein n=1 Tax=Nitrosomonas sp. Nm51 TaxID=133720 RepID=UPI0008D7EC1F|nr:macro domain-containing protein [Nitrosomonas sp. Nm51]SER22748.1 O-acetyl-ADP-ribose deacetylase (regulator of RNase III), contains Macro domain [Nitrosomonas sp. Nm51]
MVTQFKSNGVLIECIQGNIAEQPDMAAIVNAANAALQTGGGVAGAIHRAAGPELEAECRQFAPIRPGQAVITGACRLPNRYVIHCLGPVYGVDEPSDVLLASCYRRALQLAEENGVESIAFPAISTGVFGFPLPSAARIALKTALDALPNLVRVKHIRFVLFGESDLRVFVEALNACTSK